MMKLALITLSIVVVNLISLAQSSPESFAYVLQADGLAKSKAEAVTKLAGCGRDWIVLDTHFSGDEA